MQPTKLTSVNLQFPACRIHTVCRRLSWRRDTLSGTTTARIHAHGHGCMGTAEAPLRVWQWLQPVRRRGQGAQDTDTSFRSQLTGNW